MFGLKRTITSYCLTLFSKMQICPRHYDVSCAVLHDHKMTDHLLPHRGFTIKLKLKQVVWYSWFRQKEFRKLQYLFHLGQISDNNFRHLAETSLKMKPTKRELDGNNICKNDSSTAALRFLEYPTRNNTKEVGREVHKVVPDVNVLVLLTIIIEE